MTARIRAPRAIRASPVRSMLVVETAGEGKASCVIRVRRQAGSDASREVLFPSAFDAHAALSGAAIPRTVPLRCFRVLRGQALPGPRATLHPCGFSLNASRKWVISNPFTLGRFPPNTDHSSPCSSRATFLYPPAGSVVSCSGCTCAISALGIPVIAPGILPFAALFLIHRRGHRSSRSADPPAVSLQRPPRLFFVEGPTVLSSALPPPFQMTADQGSSNRGFWAFTR